jgi:hypothetical protein
MIDWLNGIHLPVELMHDEGSQKTKRHFYIINGQPVTVYETPAKEKVPEEHEEWERK